MSRRRVYVLYQHLPHYRSAVFRGLDASADCVFVADTTTRADALKVMDHRVLANFVRVRNLWIGPFLWQRGAVRLAARSDRRAVWIVLGDAAYLSTWVVLLLLRARGVKVYCWTQGWKPGALPPTDVRGKAWDALKVAMLRLSHGVLLYAESGRAAAESRGVPSHKLHIVGNAMVEPRPIAPGRAGGELNVLFIGRLHPRKRVDLLIEAAARARIDLRIRVHLIGDGPCGADLMRLAREKDVEVVMHGAVHNEDEIERLVRECQVGVVPAAAGLSVVHMLTYGLPVVVSSTSVGQGPEWSFVRPGVTGFHFRDGDPESLKSVLVDVASMPPAVWRSLCSDVDQLARSELSPGRVVERILAAVELA